MNINKDKFLDFNYQRKKFLKIIDSFDSKDKNKILKAFKLAEKGHKGQMRDTNIPYFIHPIRAALLLIEEAKIKKVNLICVLLLHDVLEDTNIPAKEIKNRLGNEVLRLVKAVTRERSESETPDEKAKSKQKKIKRLVKSSKEVRLIKLCDKLDNRLSQDFIPEGHPSRNKFERWNKEFKQYLSIAEKTNKNLFKIFKAVVG